MDRIERLVNLVAALLDTERPLTADEIRERVPGFPNEPGPTFHRAFERDKASLREMGVPIEVTELDPGNAESDIGYRIRPERYELPDPGLEPDEVAALHLAATQVRLDGGDATEAVWKLGGVPGDPLARAATTAELPGSVHLPALFAAASEHRTVRFAYRGSPRTVDPWRLQFRNGAWYLVGFDHDRGDRRTFRLDRVTGAVDAGPSGAFQPPEQPPPVATRPWEMGDEEPVEVRVKVDADQAAWAEANAQVPVVRGGDGSVQLAMRVTNRAGLRSWVLGFLDHAEILSPASERDAITAWLARWEEA